MLFPLHPRDEADAVYPILRFPHRRENAVGKRRMSLANVNIDVQTTMLFNRELLLSAT